MVARHNLCFSDFSQKGKGTIISFKDVPLLEHVKSKLSSVFGKKAKNLQADDIEKCGIGYHGDTGIRLGEELPLCFQWYLEKI